VAAVTALLLAIIVLLVVLLVRDEGTEVQTVASTTTASSPTLPGTGDDGSTPTSGSTATTAATTTSASTSSASTSTTASSTTTTAPTTTATTATTTTIPSWADSAVWPWYDSPVRYDDPVEAAGGFATSYAGFVDPIVGPFLQGDSQSGEVEVRATDRGPVTTVLVRRLGPDGDWFVVGAVADELRIEQPGALDEVTSPLAVTGEVLAFEGRAGLQLRADDSHAPIYDGYVTGGGDQPRPFETEITFVEPAGGGGALMLRTHSMDDGAVQQVAVRRVLFPA
jgi:hypothetical protein